MDKLANMVVLLRGLTVRVDVTALLQLVGLEIIARFQLPVQMEQMVKAVIMELL